MEAGKNRRFFVEGEQRGLALVRNADVQCPDIRSVGIAVCLQEVIHHRGRLAGVNRRVLATAHHKQGEEPDIGADIHDGVSVLQSDAMPQIALVLENLVVDVVRLILIQVNDFQAVRQHASRPSSKAFCRPILAEMHRRVPIPGGPFLQPQKDDIDPIAVPPKCAARVQQLLKDLVVRGKFGADPNVEMVAPEFQHVLQRFGGKVGGDHEVCGRPFIGTTNGLEKGEGDPGEVQVLPAPLVEDANVADEALFLVVTRCTQSGVPPQRIGEVQVRNLDLFDGAQYEGLAFPRHERRQQLRDGIQQARVQDVWLALVVFSRR